MSDTPCPKTRMKSAVSAAFVTSVLVESLVHRCRFQPSGFISFAISSKGSAGPEKTSTSGMLVRPQFDMCIDSEMANSVHCRT